MSTRQVSDRNDPVIESTAQLIAPMIKGEKPRERWRIGTEHEKFAFYRDTLKPVPYEGEHGIGALLNKLDVLSGIPEILLCVAYEIDGKRVERWPSSTAELSRATPIYEHFPGWSEPIHNVRALADLPENARRYVTALEELAGAPIVLLSVGPERTQTIERAWRPMRRSVNRP